MTREKRNAMLYTNHVNKDIHDKAVTEVNTDAWSNYDAERAYSQGGHAWSAYSDDETNALYDTFFGSKF